MANAPSSFPPVMLNASVWAGSAFTSGSDAATVSSAVPAGAISLTEAASDSPSISGASLASRMETVTMISSERDWPSAKFSSNPGAKPPP